MLEARPLLTGLGFTGKRPVFRFRDGVSLTGTIRRGNGPGLGLRGTCRKWNCRCVHPLCVSSGRLLMGRMTRRRQNATVEPVTLRRRSHPPYIGDFCGIERRLQPTLYPTFAAELTQPRRGAAQRGACIARTRIEARHRAKAPTLRSSESDNRAVASPAWTAGASWRFRFHPAAGNGRA